jgi:hypothetical protein
VSWTSFDVSGEAFIDLDSEDAILSCRVDDVLPSTKRFLAFGVVLRRALAEVAPEYGSAGGREPRLYVRSWSLLTVDGIVAGEFWVALYRPELGGATAELLKGTNGQEVVLSRDWGSEEDRSEEPRPGVTQYDFGSFMEFPYGNAGLTLWATGRVSLCCDSSTFEPYPPGGIDAFGELASWRDQQIEALARRPTEQK